MTETRFLITSPREERGVRMKWHKEISRRGFLKGVAAGVCLSMLHPLHRVAGAAATPGNPLFHIKGIPDDPFYGGGNYHEGVDALVHLMGKHDLKFYRSSQETAHSGPFGMIAPDDVVLIKVNAQWKYRGCTNSDLIRGLVQRILGHPDGFRGEVVIFENGQGRGSLNCDTSLAYGGDSSVHANANDGAHSFLYLVSTIFDDPRVSSFLLDPIAGIFIGKDDHVTNGYRLYENVSYPCFTTTGGHRVELREGLWKGNEYGQNLKLINVPVLKHHDTGGSEITASLKHVYGIVSMSDGNSGFRHYNGLGETCGKMMVSVRTPILNIIDAIWVSYTSLTGYPSATTYRTNQILASQDPVALDYWAAKYVLFPIDNNPRHHPDFPGIDAWLTSARDTINGQGGLYDPERGIYLDQVTKDEGEIVAYVANSGPPAPDIKANDSDGPITLSQNNPLSITVKFDPGSHSGENADWWVVAMTPFGWYHYDVPGDSWKPGLVVTHRGPLFDLSTMEVLNHSGLPIGSYTFYFGVDMNMNGSVDMEKAHYDSVGVNIVL
jgi:hypothetical protein